MGSLSWASQWNSRYVACQHCVDYRSNSWFHQRWWLMERGRHIVKCYRCQFCLDWSRVPKTHRICTYLWVHRWTQTRQKVFWTSFVEGCFFLWSYHLRRLWWPDFWFLLNLQYSIFKKSLSKKSLVNPCLWFSQFGNFVTASTCFGKSALLT